MEKWRLFLHVAQWTVSVIGLVCLPLPVLVAQESVELNSAELIKHDSDVPSMLTITTFQPAVQDRVVLSLLIVFVCANMLAGLGWLCSAGSITSRIVVQVIGLMLPFACCAGSLSTLAPWRYGEPVRGADHESYYMMESSFLQGQTLVLARLEEEDWLRRTSKVLVETNGDNPRTWQSMIRPAGAEEAYGLTVALSPTGMVLGFRYDNHCFFAYDVAANEPYGRNRIRGISPFVLLAADTPLHSLDVKRLEKIVQAHDSHTSGVPQKAQLEDATRHPNPSVATLAKKLLAERKQ